MTPNFTNLIKDDKIYNVHNCIELFDKIDMKTVKRNHIEFFNTAVSFDIETSSFYDPEILSKCANMYIWQMCFSGGIIIGRTWADFVNTLWMIHNYYETSDSRKLVIYVHNLQYEFQFIRKWFKWDSVFAIDERKVVKAVTNIGIEFRCSYILTNISLKKMAEDLPDEYNGISKLMGELDYTQIRGPETPLSDAELQYCINDVLIVVYFIYDKLQHENSIANIPLTATGYVRKAVRKNCLYNKEYYAKSWAYKRYIHTLNLTKDDYFMLHDAFRGGHTHSSCLSTCKVIPDVGSIDFISAYPAECLYELYPNESFKDIKLNSMAEFRNYLKYYACLFQIEFFDLKAAVIFEHVLSESNCTVCDGAVIDNGRIVSAKRIVTTITELDFEVIEKYYTWDKMRIGKFKAARKGYLPTLFIESVLSFYKDKTKLKGVAGRERDYVNAKSRLNSLYGMMVTDICKEDIIYVNDEWDVADYNIDEKIKQYNESKSRFLFYAWGIWVTAYCRRNLLLSVFYEFKNDYIYSDTDSIKFKNIEAHLPFIEKYNKSVRMKTERALLNHRIEAAEAEPETIKGEKKHIGFFEYEGKYDKFKSLGAKRYLTEINGDIDLTCAGLNAADAGAFIASKESPFDFFSDNMYIPKEYTGKLTHTYIDDEIEGTATDYQGNEFKYYEKSCVHLEMQDYDLSIGRIYADFLKGVKTKYEK